MPEMPNVVSGAVIESEWGNDIRDRTIQRYISVAERTALVTAPVVGDLAFMENTGELYVYYSGGWKFLGGSSAPQEVESFAAVANANTTGSAANLCSGTIAIPSHWTGWKALFISTWTHSTLTAGTASGYWTARVAGTDLDQMTNASGINAQTGALMVSLAGFTATGSVAFSLRGYHSPSPTIQCSGINVYVRALRTS